MPDGERDGLTAQEAQRRFERDGANELPLSRPRSALRLLREVFAEPMFLLLVACGAIYLLLGDRHEAAMLLGFVLVVIAITFIQQRRSERSLEALRDLSSPRAMVVRDGVACRVAGRDLVVGDVVLLAEGDRVPADLQLLAAANLSVDESLLSGESAPVAKRAGPTDRAAGIDCRDRRRPRARSPAPWSRRERRAASWWRPARTVRSGASASPCRPSPSSARRCSTRRSASCAGWRRSG